jgi:hypothetical protein
VRLVTGTRSVRVSLAGAVLGFGLAGMAAPAASAEPVVPGEPVVPVPLELPPPPAADPAALAQAAAPALLTPAEGTSHLPSPDSLPPGTTQTAPEHSTLDYLKDVWKALRTEEVSASDALLLLAQRPVNNTKVADSVPQSQSGPADPPAAAPAEDPGAAPAQTAPAAEASAPVPPLPAPAG